MFKQQMDGSKINIFNDEKENLPPIDREEKYAKPGPRFVSIGQTDNGGPRKHLRVINPNTNEIHYNIPGPTVHEIDKKTATSVKDTVIDIEQGESDDLDSTPMSVSDMSSQMSMDFSIDSLQLTDSTDSIDVGKERYSLQELDENSTQLNDDYLHFFEVVDYQKDILKRFKESELKHVPNARYMNFQQDISHRMRSIAIDWLVDVTEEYHMDNETLYLTVSYMDRFLSRMAVVRSKLQLVAVTSLYIAAKYEEVDTPGVAELLCNTDNCYTKEQMLHMEQAILKVLSFNLCTPTANVFINAYSVMCSMTEELKYLTQFLCELSLIEGDTYLKYLPSFISSASLALSRHILGMDIWTNQLEEITNYGLDDLKIVILQLNQTHKKSKEQQTHAIVDKYQIKKYRNVASIEPIELTKKQLDKLCSTYQEEATKSN